jgi:hypothetical protein
MAERLLVVEEAFRARGRGVLLAPKRVLHGAPGATFPVVLKLPGGGERTTIASFDVAHVRGPLTPFAMLRLPELAPEDVPVGTEVWAVD